MGKSLIDYVEDLSWDASDEEQSEAISVLEKWCKDMPGSMNIVMRTNMDKTIWDNEALIVCKQSDSVLERYIADLFRWIRDMNWPGAECVFNRLVAMSDESISQGLTNAIRWAKADGNTMWLCVLDDLVKERNKKSKQ